jgi:hypothetical protein
MMIFAVAMIQLTGPDDQRIDINPAEIVSIRSPRSTEHFAKGVRCIINTVDGKFVAVIEDCGTILKRVTKEE